MPTYCLNNLRERPAQRIRNAEHALSVAHLLAEDFASQAAERDQERRLPFDEIERYSESGLWAITVPASHGGADLDTATIVAISRIIAAADPSIAQIPQSHFAAVNSLRNTGTPEQHALFYPLLLDGLRLGNAAAEMSKHVAHDFQTRLVKDGSRLLLRGRKFYSTGALFAHLIPVAAIDEDGLRVSAIVPANAKGVELINDWSAFGQRTTASGSVLLDDVEVDESHVLRSHQALSSPTAHGPFAQIIQAAIDLGIADAAIADTIYHVKHHARAWRDSGQAQASDDPYTLAKVGDLKLRQAAAAALLTQAAQQVEAARHAPTAESVAQASIAVAQAKILTTELALKASSDLFELAGTRATLAPHQLDRHWRNARTHTTHDPVRWKYHVIGNYYLNDALPPRHGLV